MFGFGYGLTIGSRRAPSFIGPLDAFAGQLYAVTGPHRAFSSYAGPCWRVRRSIDGGEEDIGFTADGWVDSAHLLSVAAGGSLYIIRDYDKTGNGRDGVQAGTGSQPRIVSAGVLDAGPNGQPAPFYDGVNDFMEIQNSVGFNRNLAAATFAAVSRATGGTSQAVFANSYVAQATSTRVLLFHGSATTTSLQARNADVGGLYTVNGATVTSGAWTRLIGRARYAAGGLDIAVNGAVSTGTILPAQNTPDADSAANVRIGAVTSNQLYIAGGISTVVLSQSALNLPSLNTALSQMMP